MRWSRPGSSRHSTRRPTASGLMPPQRKATGLPRADAGTHVAAGFAVAVALTPPGGIGADNHARHLSDGLALPARCATRARLGSRFAGEAPRLSAQSLIRWTSRPRRSGGFFMSARKIVVYDTTLRDGAQGPAVSFSAADKERIARLLDRLGVDYVEGGFPGSNSENEEALAPPRPPPPHPAARGAFR